MVRVEADADARIDEHLLVLKAEGLPEQVENVLGHRCRILAPLQCLDDEDEFIAAQAGDGILRTHCLFQPFGDPLQKEVTHGVAHGVVDVLEAIQIEEQHGGPGPLTLGTQDCLLQAVVEQQPVGEFGQRVVVRQMGELVLGLLDTTDITEYSDMVGGVALFVLHHVDGQQLGVDLAILAPVPEFTLPLAGLFERAPHGLEEGLVVPTRLKQGGVFPHHLFRGVAGDPGEGAVDGDDAMPGVGNDDPFRRSFEHHSGLAQMALGLVDLLDHVVEALHQRFQLLQGGGDPGRTVVLSPDAGEIPGELADRAVDPVDQQQSEPYERHHCGGHPCQHLQHIGADGAHHLLAVHLGDDAPVHVLDRDHHSVDRFPFQPPIDLRRRPLVAGDERLHDGNGVDSLPPLETVVAGAEQVAGIVDQVSGDLVVVDTVEVLHQRFPQGRSLNLRGENRHRPVGRADRDRHGEDGALLVEANRTDIGPPCQREGELFGRDFTLGQPDMQRGPAIGGLHLAVVSLQCGDDFAIRFLQQQGGKCRLALHHLAEQGVEQPVVHLLLRSQHVGDGVALVLQQGEESRYLLVDVVDAQLLEIFLLLQRLVEKLVVVEQTNP